MYEVFFVNFYITDLGHVDTIYGLLTHASMAFSFV